MAEVFRALDTESGREVALKRFLPQSAGYSRDARFAIRFREQLKSLAGVEHPELVPILDYGLTDDRYFIVTAWVEGIHLSTYLAEYGAFSPPAAVHVARQICAALGAVHSHGLVHRGLKPENIFLTSRGRVQVTDAGLSQLMSDSGLSKTSVMLGAVDYMSPEQARGKPTGPESDIYSLGVILYEMLTDRLPFESSDSWSVVSMHVQKAPPSLQERNAEVTPELASVVEKALHKSRDGRFANAQELDAALAPLPQSDDLLWLITPKHAGQNGRRRFALRSDRTWKQAARLRAARIPAAIDSRARTLHERFLGFSADRAEPTFRSLALSFRKLTLGQRLALQFIVTFIVAFLLFYALAGTLTG